MKTPHVIALLSMLVLTSCGQGGSKTSEMDPSIKLDPYKDLYNPKGQHDERIFNTLPTKIDLSDKMGPVKYQYDRGSCSFFVATSLVESLIKIKFDEDINLSEEHMISEIKSSGYNQTTETSSAYVNLERTKTFKLEAYAPYQPSKLNSPNCKGSCLYQPLNLENSFSARGLRPVLVSGSIDKLIQHLAETKTPAIANVVTHPAGWSNTQYIFHNQDLRKECISEPKKCGTHAILISGYDAEKKVFFFKNSWGKHWGNAGYGKISFETLQKFASPVYISATLSDSFILPQNKEDYIRMPKLLEMKLISKLNHDNSVSLNAMANLNLPGFAVRHFVELTKKTKSIDNEPRLVPLSGVKAEKFKQPWIRVEELVSSQNAEALNMTINHEMMEGNSPKSLSSDEEFQLKHTVSVFTDEGYRWLGTKFSDFPAN